MKITEKPETLQQYMNWFLQGKGELLYNVGAAELKVFLSLYCILLAFQFSSLQVQGSILTASQMFYMPSLSCTYNTQNKNKTKENKVI